MTKSFFSRKPAEQMIAELEPLDDALTPLATAMTEEQLRDHLAESLIQRSSKVVEDTLRTSPSRSARTKLAATRLASSSASSASTGNTPRAPSSAPAALHRHTRRPIQCARRRGHRFLVRHRDTATVAITAPARSRWVLQWRRPLLAAARGISRSSRRIRPRRSQRAARRALLARRRARVALTRLALISCVRCALLALIVAVAGAVLSPFVLSCAFFASFLLFLFAFVELLIVYLVLCLV